MDAMRGNQKTYSSVVLQEQNKYTWQVYMRSCFLCGALFVIA